MGQLRGGGERDEGRDGGRKGKEEKREELPFGLRDSYQHTFPWQLCHLKGTTTLLTLEI